MRHALRKHAKYGGSSAYRWMSCYGSVKLAERVAPLPKTKYALDGEEAHEVLDFALKNGLWDAHDASLENKTYIRDTADETNGRLDAIQVALDEIARLLDAHPDAIMYVEQSFQFPSFIDPDEAYGTCDCLIYVPSLDLVYVIDYKHGIGITVDADDNKQGLYYATGAVEGGIIDASTVVIVIIQPRAFHPLGPIRQDVVTRKRLVDFAAEVDNAIVRCQADDAPLVPTEDNCQFCPARLECPAREARALTVVGNNFASVRMLTQDMLPDVKTLPVDKLAFILDAAPMLESFLRDAYNIAFQHAMNGGTIPNRKLVETQARRKWFVENQTDEQIAAALMRLVGTDDWDKVYPRKLINITEADELVKKAFKDRVGRGHKKQAAEDAGKAMAALTIKESSGNLTLVPITDSRPAADRAGTAFAGVKTLPPDWDKGDKIPF